MRCDASTSMLVALALTISLFQVGNCGVVKQSGKRIAPGGIVYSEQRKEFTCSGGDGYYASPGECTNVYYYCENGLAEAQTCPEGEVFDPVTFVCITSNQASCNQEFDCPSDGIFPYPDACTNLYYICSGGQFYIEYCPENFVFDPITLKCVPKGSASCSPTTTELPTTVTETPTTEAEAPTTETEAPTTEAEEPTTEAEVPTTETEVPTEIFFIMEPLQPYKMLTSTKFTCPSDQHGLYANTCTTYYECIAGVPYLRSCPKCTGIRLLGSLPTCAYLYDNDPCYSENTCP